MLINSKAAEFGNLTILSVFFFYKNALDFFLFYYMSFGPENVFFMKI